MSIIPEVSGSFRKTVRIGETRLSLGCLAPFELLLSRVLLEVKVLLESPPSINADDCALFIEIRVNLIPPERTIRGVRISTNKHVVDSGVRNPLIVSDL